MNCSLGDRDWQMLYSKVSEVRKALAIPRSRLFLLFCRSHCFSRRLFHPFLTVCVQNQLQCFSWGPPEAEGYVTIHVSSHPSWCYFACFTKVLPMFSSWSAGTILLEAFPGALWQSWAHHAPRQPPVLVGAWDSAHGPVWIRPFVFFRLFLWLLRSFWILSLPAGYLQSLVAFHYINKFTVYYLVAARPGPRSVLYSVCASGGSQLLFCILTNANKMVNTNFGCRYKGTLSWHSSFPVLYRSNCAKSSP